MTIILSCKPTSDFDRAMKEMKKEKSFFDPVELGSGGGKGNFTIITQFDECGEWGGHNEGMKIYAKPKSKIFYLDYFRTSVDCNLQESSSTYFQDTVISKTIELNKVKEKVILKYLKSLVEAKVTSRFPGHSGNYFEAKKSDSTFYIQLIDGRKSTKGSYSKLLKKLDLN
jgi:hypothetical protein